MTRCVPAGTEHQELERDIRMLADTLNAHHLSKHACSTCGATTTCNGHRDSMRSEVHERRT